MHFPVMVVKTSHKELIEAKEKWEDKINTLPFWHNDRNPQSKYNGVSGEEANVLMLQEHLKYTHIASVVLPSIQKQ